MMIAQDESQKPNQTTDELPTDGNLASSVTNTATVVIGSQVVNTDNVGETAHPASNDTNSDFPSTETITIESTSIDVTNNMNGEAETAESKDSNSDCQNKDDKNLVPKDETIKVELEKNALPLRISSKKRPTKAKKLKDEEFTFSVYKKDMAGFTTVRPIRWALAVEKYAETATCRWHYKLNKKTRKYTEARILFSFKNCILTLNIYFSTGVITLQGEHHKDWICNEFPKVNDIFQNQDEPDQGEELDRNNDELTLDIDSLYKKIEELENAIITQDKVIHGIITRCQNVELKLNAIDIESQVLKVEKNLDKRLTVFFENFTKDTEKKVVTIQKHLRSQTTEMQRRIGEFKVSVQNQINPLIPAVNEVNLIKEKLKTIDVNGIKQSIEPEAEINKEEFTKQSKELLNLQKIVNELNTKIETAEKDTKTQVKTAESRTKENQPEILMFFDSNGTHIDRKLLWKVDNSVFTRCGNIYEVSKSITETKITKLDYILLSIGVNDLDLKDHEQAFGEMRELIDQIRKKYHNIKIIVGEATPRTDERDNEVKEYNEMLRMFASENEDITVALHGNLRDPTWSLYRDTKHIHKLKIGRYAGNTIRALKKAYNITSKRELFRNHEKYLKNVGESYENVPSLFAHTISRTPNLQHALQSHLQPSRTDFNGPFRNRMENLADYEMYPRHPYQSPRR